MSFKTFLKKAVQGTMISDNLTLYFFFDILKTVGTRVKIC